MSSPKKPRPKKSPARPRPPRIATEIHVHLPENTEAKVESVGRMTHIHVCPPIVAVATALRTLAADNVIDASKALVDFYAKHPRPTDAAELGLIDGLRLALECI